jgi:FG-GAP repeat protein
MDKRNTRSLSYHCVRPAKRWTMVVLFQVGLALSQGLLATAYADRRHPDFNGDGFADLAVGIPGHDILDSRGSVTARDAGAVNVFYGSRAAIESSGAQMWTQDTTLFNDSVRGAAESDDRFGSALTWGDFNGDGFHDLAVGVPGEKVGTVKGGAVNVLYGSLFGLTAAQNQMWYQGAISVGIAIRGTVEASDRFGSALAAGDFNNDGFDDLAIGAPGESVNGQTLAGAVNVIYGSSTGLVASGRNIPHNQIFHQGVLIDPAEFFDQFGYSLAAGDFDGDGDDDLAVGVPFETVNDREFAGAVNVIYGTTAGLTEQGNQFLHQNSPGLEGTAEPGDFFGYSLAAGDFVGYYGGDSLIEELVVGVPGEDVHESSFCLFLSCILTFADPNEVDNGAIQVLYGTSRGFGDRDRIFHQGSELVAGKSEAGDFFGSSLAVGDFSGDGIDDLAVGVPGEKVDGADNAGAITVFLGGMDGLMAWGSRVIHQNSGIETAERDDRFGGWLFSGDFNGDGHDDLGVSVPGEDLEAFRLTDSGAVNVLWGSNVGLTAASSQIVVKHAVPRWIGGQPAPAAFDHFGGSGPGNAR